MAKRILIIEDEQTFASVLKDYLELTNYKVTLSINGEQGITEFDANGADLILLDVMMPEMDGFTVAKTIRKKNAAVPIIFLTAKNMKEDMIEGFKSGADDYITKPFDSEVLLAKIEAVLRRSRDSIIEPKKSVLLNFGSFEYDTELRSLQIGDDPNKVRLSPKEGKLLEILVNNKGNLVSRENALNTIWGNSDYFTARSMDVYVTKLRKILKPDSNIAIENIHGAGFRLLVNNE